MAEWLPCGPSGLSARSIGVCAGTSLIAIATPKPLLREGWCENRLPNFLPVTCEFQTFKEYILSVKSSHTFQCFSGLNLRPCSIPFCSGSLPAEFKRQNRPPIFATALAPPREPRLFLATHCRWSTLGLYRNFSLLQMSFGESEDEAAQSTKPRLNYFWVHVRGFETFDLKL